MKRFFFKKSFLRGLVICSFLTLSFFLPKILSGFIPVPADNLLGLYHPFRDINFEGYNAGKFPAKNPLITDPILQIYPWKKTVIENIKSFQIPYWNPYSFSGQPLLGNIQSSPFSALNLFLLLFPFRIGWGFYVILPTVLSSVFMYLFLSGNKRLNLPNSAAVFGAVVLPFTGFFVAWLGWGTIVSTAMWLPLLLFLIDKYFGQTKMIWILLLAFGFVQTLISGHAQTALYVLLATFLYTLFEMKENLKKSAVVFFVFLVSLLIAAPQILPSLDFVMASARSVDQGYYLGRVDWFVPFAHLLQLVVPDFFGNPSTYNYWGVWNYAEFVSFIGVIPATFVLMNFLNKDKRSLAFPIALLTIALALALKNPISLLPYTLNVPFISSFQPSRIILLINFSLVILAAAGFKTFMLSSWKKTIIISVLPVILVFVILTVTFIFRESFPEVKLMEPWHIALKNTLPTAALAIGFFMIVLFKNIRFSGAKRFVPLLVFGLVVFEMFRFGYKFTSFSKPSWVFPKTKVIDFLMSQDRPFRVMSTDRRILHPNVSGVYKIESVEGYDPLYLDSYGRFVASWQAGQFRDKTPSYNRIITPQKIDSKVLDLLNVKYVLSFDEIQGANFSKVMEEGETKLYQNNNFLPRMFFVNEIVKTDSREEINLLLKDSFDLSKRATSTELDIKTDQTASSLDLVKYSDNQIKFVTTSLIQKPLVVTNINYPGWRAKIDGRETQLYKVNGIFQSVLIPSGTHMVELQYLYQHWAASFLMSAFGFMLLFFVVFYTRIKNIILQAKNV